MATPNKSGRGDELSNQIGKCFDASSGYARKKMVKYNNKK